MEWKSGTQTDAMKEARKAWKSLACSAVIGLALATGTAKADIPDYEITGPIFPVLGHYETYISHINNNNDIVGNYTVIDGRFLSIISKKPYLLRGDVFYGLGGIPEDFFGGATAIAEHNGNMLLYEEDRITEDFKESYYYTGETDMVPLGFEGHDMSYRGFIVGEDYLYIGREVRRIGPEDSNDTYMGYGINDNDVFVGCIKTNDGNSYNDIPFKWENGEITYLPIPEDAEGGWATRINNSGQIIGSITKVWMWDSRIKVEEFASMWENGEYVDLSSFLDKAYDINNNGQVVGFVYEGSRKNAAMLDLESRIVTNLNSFIPNDANGDDDFYRLNYAWRINDDGWISGRGCINKYQIWCDATGAGQKAFLMKPKPEPNADINGDGIVNWEDFAILAEQWLEEKE